MYRLFTVLFAAAILRPAALSQSHTPSPTEAARFEVASIRLNKSSDPPTSNFPLGPGDVYTRNGGLFSAKGQTLRVYLNFAYKVSGNQGQYITPQLPTWAKEELYDIEARAANDPGKDGMRLLMRFLLADRFHLSAHYEDREVPVFALTLAKNRKTGPELLNHRDDSPCPTEQPTSSTPYLVNGKPAFCSGIFPLKATVPGRLRFGGRNVSIGFIADTFSQGTRLGRPMIDRTGLTGTFDFTLEWWQDPRDGAATGANSPDDPNAPSFEQALREQLGIRLDAGKGPIKVLVIDRVERPTDN